MVVFWLEASRECKEQNVRTMDFRKQVMLEEVKPFLKLKATFLSELRKKLIPTMSFEYKSHSLQE